jgi:hypothetical protein
MLPWEFILAMITWAAAPAEIPSDGVRTITQDCTMQNVSHERPRASGAREVISLADTESPIDSQYASQNGGRPSRPRPFFTCDRERK